jgi:hypothetical protein
MVVRIVVDGNYLEVSHDEYDIIARGYEVYTLT